MIRIYCRPDEMPSKKKRKTKVINYNNKCKYSCFYLDFKFLICPNTKRIALLVFKNKDYKHKICIGTISLQFNFKKKKHVSSITIDQRSFYYFTVHLQDIFIFLIIIKNKKALIVIPKSKNQMLLFFSVCKSNPNTTTFS